MVEMKPIPNSSALGGASYDPETQVLTVVFRNGSSVTYSGVPAETYEELMNADSPGSYYAANIRGQYT